MLLITWLDLIPSSSALTGIFVELLFLVRCWLPFTICNASHPYSCFSAKPADSTVGSHPQVPSHPDIQCLFPAFAWFRSSSFGRWRISGGTFMILTSFWPISMHLLSANQTWLENPSSMNEFPIQTSVYKGFPVAMFDDRRVSMGKWYCRNRNIDWRW